MTNKWVTPPEDSREVFKRRKEFILADAHKLISCVFSSYEHCPRGNFLVILNDIKNQVEWWWKDVEGYMWHDRHK